MLWNLSLYQIYGIDKIIKGRAGGVNVLSLYGGNN
jgi:hypothetical protein